MAVGFPTKVNYATGDVLSATNMNDLSGTVNLLDGTQYSGGKNRVLNSAMQVWQRGTSLALSSSATNYTADRWATVSGNTGTASRQATGDTTNLPNIQYCLRMQRTAGVTTTNGMYIYQSMESVNSIPLAGKTVTFSFYARKGANFSPTSGGASVKIYYGTGTDQNVLTGYTGSTDILSGATVTPTTTWARYTYTATVPSTATEIAPGIEWVPNGTAGAADYLEITGVQLEASTVASAFSTNGGTYQAELAACQRYYYRSSGNFTFGTGVSTSSTSAQITIKPPTTLRVSPASIDFSTLGIGDRTNYTLTVSNVAFYTNNVDLIELTVTNGAGATTNRFAFLAATSAAGYLGFNAEL